VLHKTSEHKRLAGHAVKKQVVDQRKTIPQHVVLYAFHINNLNSGNQFPMADLSGEEIVAALDAIYIHLAFTAADQAFHAVVD
jgi:hypothetical protein